MQNFLFFSVKLNANRMVVGTLRGFDQFMNLVVDNTVEVNGNEKTDIGMVVSSIGFVWCFNLYIFAKSLCINDF